MIQKREAGWLLLLLLLCAYTLFFRRPERFLAVSVPVADIRSIPQDAKPGYGHDDLNETQVLYNEILRYRGENADWYQVEAQEQKEFSHHKLWQGYPGWIRKEKAVFIGGSPDHNLVVNVRAAKIFSGPSFSSEMLFPVYLGTKFKEIGRQAYFYKVRLPGNACGWIAENEVARIDAKLDEVRRRQNIVGEAKLFLETPYLWGGRAIGVDCSGLVNLAYRASGIDIARDAHEQWMISKPIRADELKPADLIFLSRKDDFTSIVHVMLFLGGEDFIEGPGTGKRVRICNFKEKFGLSLPELKEKNYIASGQKIYFGRILP